MSRIAERFQALKARGEAALVIFVTGGDPPISELPEILRTIEGAGADLVEIGLPFSDPIADGPTIQASSQRALDAGVKLRDILHGVREASLTIPTLVMGYANTAMRCGFSEFADSLRAAGVDGALLSDLIPDEADEWVETAHAAGLDTVFLVAPTSTDERIQLACRLSTGFVYCVSRTGVTGSAASVPDEVEAMVSRVRAHTQLPLCVGFGITNPEQVSAVCGFADGAIVGSHIVSLLHDSWDGGRGRNLLYDSVAALKAGALRV